jgi:hypothetical protein
LVPDGLVRCEVAAVDPSSDLHEFGWYDAKIGEEVAEGVGAPKSNHHLFLVFVNEDPHLRVLAIYEYELVVSGVRIDDHELLGGDLVIKVREPREICKFE